MVENKKTPFYKKTWFKVVAALVIISAIFSPKDKDKKTEDAPTEKVAEVIEEPKEEPKENNETPVEVEKEVVSNEPAPAVQDTQKEEVPTSNVSNDQMKEAGLALLKENFKEFCDIEAETDGNIYFVHMYPKDQLKSEIITLLANPNDETLKSSWNTMAEGLINMSGEFDSNIEENVSIMLYNPLNTENVLFSTIGNAETYNFMKEQ